MSHKKFEDLTLEEKVNLFSHWVEGGEIYVQDHEGNWILVEHPQWHGFGVYKKKDIPPSINWGEVSEEYKWLAVDFDGRAYLYKDKPSHAFRSDYWVSNGTGHCGLANVFTSYKRGNVPWDQSLVQRPE